MCASLSVLIVDPSHGHGLAESLARCGFTVIAAGTPEEALFEFGQHAVDVVVASLPLPGMGAAQLCKELRIRGRTPVLVVTAGRGAEWLDALGAGADDHVTIPCDERELRARLWALIRRSRGPLSPGRAVTVGDLTVRLAGGRMRVEPALALTPVQSTLLEYLAEHPGVVLSKTALRERVCLVDGPTSEVQFLAEIRSLQAAVAVAAGVPDALDHIDGVGWCLSKST
jgi:DNA-binding response OmpR family regulator